MRWLVLATETAIKLDAINCAVLHRMNSSSRFLFGTIVDKAISRLAMRIYRQVVLLNHAVHHITKS